MNIVITAIAKGGNMNRLDDEDLKLHRGIRPIAHRSREGCAGRVKLARMTATCSDATLDLRVSWQTMGSGTTARIRVAA
jgi:hypothetical protein